MKKKPLIDYIDLGFSNNWKCPVCGVTVDYGKGEPSKGRTQCDSSGKEVQMVKIDDLET